MKAVFVHDHIFVRKSGLLYSDKFPYRIWKRYLDVFAELHVFSRSSERGAVDRLSVSSGDDVYFHSGDNISTLGSFLGVRREQGRRLKRLLSETDVVIVRLPSEYGLMAAAIARDLEKPCVVEVVGCAWDVLWNYGGVIPKLYAPILLARMKRAVKQAKYVSYVSDSFLQSRYPPADDSVTVSVSNVELPAMSDEVLKSRMAKIAQDSEITTFGLIGAFKTRYKGVHTAIEALSKIARRNSNVRLRILGSGDPTPYLQMVDNYGLQGKVFFDGVLPSGQPVFEWLDQIDIYLQPSFQEGVPRALIEAMGRGCPAIASTAGGIPELLDDEAVFSPGRVNDLVRLMEKYIGNKELLRSEASRNFEISKAYSKATLDERRHRFFSRFRNDAAR